MGKFILFAIRLIFFFFFSIPIYITLSIQITVWRSFSRGAINIISDSKFFFPNFNVNYLSVSHVQSQKKNWLYSITNLQLASNYWNNLHFVKQQIIQVYIVQKKYILWKKKFITSMDILLKVILCLEPFWVPEVILCDFMSIKFHPV